MPIYVTRPSMPSLEDYIKEIKPIFDNHILTNMGPVYKKFQHMLSSYLEVPELSLFVNGHMALEMAIQAMGLQQENGEVITTPFTFVSTTHAIARNRLKPVFCDIRKTDYCIDPENIEELITEKTVAIIPVHVYGNICDAQRIDEIAKRHHLKVIYDGAHAFGERYMGTAVGNFGDATMFSFHATKVLNSIEGGAIAFHDKKYKVPFHELKNFGIHGPEEITGIGGNAKMNEFCAAMGICNLQRMEICVSERKRVHDRYFERLSGIDGIVLCLPQEEVESNYAYMPVYFNKAKLGYNRDDVYEALIKHGIYSRKYFYPAVNDLDCYKGSNMTPIARDVSQNILTLPIFEELSNEMVDYICNIIIESK